MFAPGPTFPLVIRWLPKIPANRKPVANVLARVSAAACRRLGPGRSHSCDAGLLLQGLWAFRVIMRSKKIVYAPGISAPINTPKADQSTAKTHGGRGYPCP